MSIDFSTLQGLTIPEGVVTQIADASGAVLWKKKPAGATVTITVSGPTYYGTPGSVIIGGVSYNTPTSVVVPFGTVIVCNAKWLTSQYGAGGGNVVLNGTTVAHRVNEVNPTTYEYTVNSDVAIELANVGLPNGAGTTILITEQ